MGKYTIRILALALLSLQLVCSATVVLQCKHTNQFLFLHFSWKSICSTASKEVFLFNLLCVYLFYSKVYNCITIEYLFVIPQAESWLTWISRRSIYQTGYAPMRVEFIAALMDYATVVWQIRSATRLWMSARGSVKNPHLQKTYYGPGHPLLLYLLLNFPAQSNWLTYLLVTTHCCARRSQGKSNTIIYDIKPPILNLITETTSTAYYLWGIHVYFQYFSSIPVRDGK